MIYSRYQSLVVLHPCNGERSPEFSPILCTFTNERKWAVFLNGNSNIIFENLELPGCPFRGTGAAGFLDDQLGLRPWRSLKTHKSLRSMGLINSHYPGCQPPFLRAPCGAGPHQASK